MSSSVIRAEKLLSDLSGTFLGNFFNRGIPAFQFRIFGGDYGLMTVDELAESAKSGEQMPSGLSNELAALWLSRAGQWDQSHDLTNDIADPAGAWIHAHLHREEGDLGNASYWYHRAGREMPGSGVSIESEWYEIANVLVRSHG